MAVGHTCQVTLGGCLDDRHSTPAGSEKDASGCGSGALRRMDPGLGRKLSSRGTTDSHECCTHAYPISGKPFIPFSGRLSQHFAINVSLSMHINDWFSYILYQTTPADV